MRIYSAVVLPLLAVVSSAIAASAWSFEDATLSVSGKGAGGAVKEKLYPGTTSKSNTIQLTTAGTLKLILTATEGKTGKKPHQAFLTLHEQATGLEESFPLSAKENGKGKVEVSHKDLPYQFLTSSQPIRASIVIGSFGSSAPYEKHAFDLTVTSDAGTPISIPAAPERFASKPEIKHIFKSDPRSPPKIISSFFSLAILFALPALFGLWVGLGGNVDHFGKAFSSSPVSHALFFGSILAMEGVFFLYYLSWNLFQTLPVALVVGLVAYISGSRALTEVQERRFAGER